MSGVREYWNNIKINSCHQCHNVSKNYNCNGPFTNHPKFRLMISQVNRDEMRQRLLARAKSSGRVDDEEAVIEKRLNTCLGRSRDIGFTGCPWMAIPDYGNLCYLCFVTFYELTQPMANTLQITDLGVRKSCLSFKMFFSHLG